MNLQENNLLETNDIEVRITQDDMNAYIFITPEINKEYTSDMILEILQKCKIIAGVEIKKVEEIANNRIFLEEVLVASGIKPVDGIDGYYDVPYDFKFDNKPKILKDGSVDYNQFENFCLVHEGDVLATYIHGTKGENGLTIKGKVVHGRNGREQLPLKGKGFKISSDNPNMYIATMTGRLEYIENKSLNVSNQYDIDGDVNHATGDIQFAGDIHIRGNVGTGMTVKALGQIIVDGHVEAAYLCAGKDIVLKNGMQGAGKGIVEAGGNVTGKFFEQALIRAKGSVYANAIMNCDITAQKQISVSGRIGVILGGKSYATESIESAVIGNMVETKTILTVGVSEHTISEYTKVQEDIKVCTEELKKFDELLTKLDQYIEKAPNEEFTERKMQLIRTKFAKSSVLDGLIKHRNVLLEIMSKSAKSRVIVKKNVYPGVSVYINGCLCINKNENYNVTFDKRGDSIIMVPNV